MVKRALVLCACLSGCIDFDEAYADRLAALADAGASVDAGADDAGLVDAGAPDAGSPDAGLPDAGPRDAGNGCGASTLEFLSLYVEGDSGVPAPNGSSVGGGSVLFAGTIDGTDDLLLRHLPGGEGVVLRDAGAGVFSSGGRVGTELFYVTLDSSTFELSGLLYRADAGVQSAMTGACTGFRPGAVSSPAPHVGWYCNETDYRLCEWADGGTRVRLGAASVVGGACAFVRAHGDTVLRSGKGTGLADGGPRGVVIDEDGGTNWLPIDVRNAPSVDVQADGRLLTLDHNGLLLVNDGPSAWTRINLPDGGAFSTMVTAGARETWLAGPRSRLVTWDDAALCTPEVFGLPDAGALYQFSEARLDGQNLVLVGFLESAPTRPFVITFKRVPR
jgi:hypothetical protein